MEFSIEMDCDNAAFEDDPAEEIARILNVTAGKLRSGRHGGDLVDVNGNRVGTFDLIDDEEDEDEDDEMPTEARDIFDRAEAGDEDLEVLGVGQAANRVYDDGRWRVWVERCGPEDGYFGAPVTVEHWDGSSWSDFEVER
jgi:hypothetical protein